jgi:hypothetical protein
VQQHLLSFICLILMEVLEQLKVMLVLVEQQALEQLLKVLE